METVKEIHSASKHRSNQKQSVVQEGASTIFCELQRDLNDWITQFFVVHPLVSDEDRDAEHHTG